MHARIEAEAIQQLGVKIRQAGAPAEIHGSYERDCDRTGFVSKTNWSSIDFLFAGFKLLNTATGIYVYTVYIYIFFTVKISSFNGTINF